MTNKRRVGALKSLGVVSVGDALTYYPFRVTDPVPLRALREARAGERMAFAALVRNLRVVPMNARRGYRLEAIVDDSDFAASRRVAGAVARLVFFSYKKQYVDWVSMRLRNGSTVVVAGEPSEFNGQLQFTHPDVMTVAPAAADADNPGVVTMSTLKYDADTVDEALRRVSRPRPVYHATSRISSEHIHESILQCLTALEQSDGDDSAPADAALSRAIPDVLPEPVRAARRLMHRAEAFRAIHDPRDPKDFKRAIDTLRYEEAFVSQTALLETRRHAAKQDAHPCPDVTLRDRFIASLPFPLTGGQREVIDDIAADMSRDYPMQRLLQGEVGSGKTVVAVAAMLEAVGSGRQAVLVAPTQVLAEQHADTIRRMMETMGTADSAVTADDSDNATAVPVILLTGGMKLAARRRALAMAASGTPCIIVATHAAFSKTFQAPNLALAVIDEQHRFGVEQRESLRGKAELAPHLLVMTATPIPRTAAMTWFGDLDISWLTELPGGRKPIRTFIVPEADGATMGRMFALIRSRVDAGERAYVVCPRIDEDEPDDEAAAGARGSARSAGDVDGPDIGVYDESDAYARAGSRGGAGGAAATSASRGSSAGAGDDGEPAPQRPPLHAVSEIDRRLSALPQFRGVRFATLTGRDDDETKQRVMAAFASGETPVLVATTVIEVGVDVPQASCIVIFDADRYGLSQLHQLRGRVGRGGTNSWAFLISRAEPGSPAEQRLQVIQGTLDGAEIAQADLEFRGAGDVLGDAQSGGKSSLKLLRVVKDAKLITDARERAERLLADDPDLTAHVQLAGAVLDFTRGNEAFLISS
ncbi:ATP-dependent DNA helicase RecG [Bifidobacterium leontopitheci]|nr:ATP-dependent DNA helicase RecG [Bifidobacterium leontopitheci]